MVGVPMTWYVFAMWENPYDEHSYFQKFELRAPNDKVLVSSESPLKFESKRFLRTAVKMNAFPLTVLGEYVLHIL